MVSFLKDTGSEPLLAVFLQTAKGNSKRCKRVELLSTCVLQENVIIPTIQWVHKDPLVFNLCYNALPLGQCGEIYIYRYIFTGSEPTAIYYMA